MKKLVLALAVTALMAIPALAAGDHNYVEPAKQLGGASGFMMWLHYFPNGVGIM